MLRARVKMRSILGLIFVQDQAAARKPGCILNQGSRGSPVEWMLPWLPCIQTAPYSNHSQQTHVIASSQSLQRIRARSSRTLISNNLAVFSQTSNNYFSCSPRLYSKQSEDYEKGNVKSDSKHSKGGEITESIDDDETSKGIFQRFKDAYREYGKVLIGVHCVTSAVWFSSFYYAAYSGIDVVPLLEKLGFSESITNTFRKAGVGNIAVAYLLYKIATPARYTVTIGGTQLMVRELRRRGFMEPVPEDSRLRSLYSDMKDGVKDRVQDRMDTVKERYDDMKDDMKDKMKDRMDDVKDKMGDLQDRVKNKPESRNESQSDRPGADIETKDRPGADIETKDRPVGKASQDHKPGS